MASSADGLAVHHEGAADRAAEPADPGAQLVPVGVGRVAADGLDLGPALVLLAEDPHRLLRRSWMRRPRVCSA